MQPAIAFQPVRVVSAWTPAATRSRIGQVPAVAPAPAVLPPPSFIDGPLIRFLLDVAGATSAGLLAWLATYPGLPPKERPKPTRWHTVYVAVTGMFILKGLADLADLTRGSRV
jgi:hypothetical protein